MISIWGLHFAIASPASAVLIASPIGVGQPRSEWVIVRSACSVETAACYPAAVAISPTGSPSK